MTTDTWLADNTKQLAAAGIGSARLDCLILLEDATGKDRSWLIAHPEDVLSESIQQTLALQVNRRLEHVPIAYIRGWTEFYGRKFTVNEHVLEPRPESETIIELLLSLKLPQAATIVDVGTGSGALAVTAKLELPAITVLATDIDDNCLTVARANAKQHQVAIDFRKTDLIDGVTTADIILANLPYVPDSFTINQAATNEPRLAIFGGPDGLDLYRRMFGQLAAIKPKPAYVLCESLPPQHEGLKRIAQAFGFDLLTEQDFIQVFTRSAQLPA